MFKTWHAFRAATLKNFCGIVFLAWGVIFLLSITSWAKVPPLRVAVSIPPQSYFVDQIGGERTRVVVLLPPGANPATFEPKARTLLELARVKLYFRIHVPFENAWMEKFRAVNPAMRVVDTTQGMRVIEGDPHVWLSPDLVKHQAEIICRTLEALDPSGRKVYAANLASFKRRIKRLERVVRTRLAGVKRRTFLVYHPCWGYFARQFGLTQVAIEQRGKAPGAATMAEIIHLARQKGIHCIFVQPQFDVRNAQVIAQQIHGKLVFLDPLARDWAENLLEVAGKISQCLGS